MRRLGKEGDVIRFEARVQILGERIFLGSYQYRREALAAESVAATIRKALDRAETVKKFKHAQEVQP